MTRCLVAAVLTAACAAPAGAAGPYDDLLKHAPTHTNVLLLVDVKGAYASPLAKKERWAETVKQRGAGPFGFVPADAELVAVAAELNLTSMVREFQVGFVKAKYMPNFKELATREGGVLSEVADRPTVLSPRDVYFTSFTDGTFAAVTPADRQALARWLKAAKTGKLAPLPDYLRAAADDTAGKTVVVAVDLEDVFDPTVLRYGFAASPVIARHKNVNLNGLVAFMSKAKGLTFSAQVGEGVTGRIVVDFKDDVPRYKALLKELFLELADAYGFTIDGLANWEATFTESQMTLSGSMTTADLKRVLSVFAFPTPGASPGPNEPQDTPTVAATQRYLAQVDAVLDDLRKGPAGTSYDRMAALHDGAAKQLEQLPRTNVDPAAVDAGYQAARRLRMIATSLRGVPIDAAAASAKGYYFAHQSAWLVPYAGGWWGPARYYVARSPVQVNTNLPDVVDEINKAIAGDKKRRLETWAEIDQLLVDTRRKLGDKYKSKF